jgi:DUF4097 and DUF4098 domain-containing protein YvlB
MNTFQKVIKYIAIAFAIFLTVSILTGIVSVILSLLGAFSVNEKERIDFSNEYSDIEQIDINHKVGKLIIKPGDEFRVEASNVSKRFRAEAVKGTLVIDEPDFMNWFLRFDFGNPRKNTVITVYVPKDFYARRIKIDSGVGEVILEDLVTESLIINAGVGNIYGKNLKAKKVDAHGGVGDMTLIDIHFSDMDLDSGVGDIDIEGIIIGKSEIDCGIGDVNLRIDGARENYIMRIDDGLGSIKVNGKKTYGEYNDNYKADNTIKVDGGIGDVDIDFSR